MSSNNIVNPEQFADQLDDVRADLVSQIHRMGMRVHQAIVDYRHIAATAEEAVRTGEGPFGGTYTTDNPVQLLRDLQDTCKLAASVGVPEDAIKRARAGQFVPFVAYTTRPQQSDSMDNLRSAVRDTEAYLEGNGESDSVEVLVDAAKDALTSWDFNNTGPQRNPTGHTFDPHQFTDDSRPSVQR